MKKSLLFSILSFLGLCIVLHSCKKDQESKIPVLTTTEANNIYQTSAYLGGNITSDGGASVIARGVCWGTSQNPSTSSYKTNDGTGTGVFQSSLSGLTENTRYYVRAYATNSSGTAYGNEVSFTTLPLSLATVVTSWVNSITRIMAISHGFVAETGGGTIAECGLCWSTSENPTTADNKTSEPIDLSFTSYMTGLTPNTTYYVRAYVVTNVGISYGNQIAFTTASTFSPILFNPDLTYGTISDIDGNKYKTIQIGTQTWMAENLKTTKFIDGSEIPNVTSQSEWSNLTYPGSCWYNNEQDYTSGFGALYNWYAVHTGNICPEGWHVPSDSEWSVLVDYLGGMDAANPKLRETGTNHWQSVTSDATNSSGFTAIPAGIRFPYLGFMNLGVVIRMWTSTAGSSSGNALMIDWWYMNDDSGTSWSGDRGESNLTEGASVRCLKNN